MCMRFLSVVAIPTGGGDFFITVFDGGVGLGIGGVISGLSSSLFVRTRFLAAGWVLRG
jgi:hypothetical protein